MMRAFIFSLALAVLVSAPGAVRAEYNDPFEGYNRVMFSINDAIYAGVLTPIAKGYRAVVPQPARTGVRNFLKNLRNPLNFGHQVLQGDVDGAHKTLMRTVINTLIGVGGLFDVAAMEGIKDEPEDFGQTLGVWGVGDGPYVVPPIFPPGSLRDQMGLAVDSFIDPVRLYLFNTDRERIYYYRLGMTVIDQQEELMDVLANLKKNSVDYYAAVRSVVAQRRNALIEDQDPTSVTGADIPDYSDM